MTIDELAEKVEALDAKIDRLLEEVGVAKRAALMPNALEGRVTGSDTPGPDDG